MGAMSNQLVLIVDASVIHNVNTANPVNLCNMWTVFSRCADSVNQGRRLENLSWRLWQREQLVENTNKNNATSTAVNTNSSTNRPKKVPSEPRIPQLSGSVESLADDETVDFNSVSAPLELRPKIHTLDTSTNRYYGHISSDHFEKMVVSIVKDNTPASLTRSGSTRTESQSSDHVPEDSHPSPMPSTDGLKAQILPFPESAAAATSHDPLPEPRSPPAPKHVQPKKQPARFALGGCCSSREHSGIIEKIKATVGKKPMFQIGGSSGEDSLKSSVHSALPNTHISNLTAPALQQSEFAVDSDTETQYVDESAIDDDDSSDWEDSTEDSGKSSVDDKFFQRVESKANLASRPSLITLMFAQNERARTLGNQTSQSTSAIHRTRAAPNAPSLGASPNGSDEAPIIMKGMQHSALKLIRKIPRSSAQPITTRATHINFPAAFSPRTTRRNMLATELTESLRLNLVWERQQKKLASTAMLKRRHTSQDIANLKQYPQKACMKASEDVDAQSWNQYFSKEALNGYHSKGW